MGNQFTTGTSAIYYRRIMIYRIIFLAYLALGQQDHPGDELEPAGNTRTRQRSPFPWNGCSKSNPCGVGGGDCDGDHECQLGLSCGRDNCRDFNAGAHELADCCIEGICIKDSANRVYSTFMDMIGTATSVDKCVKFCSTYDKKIPDTNKGFPFAGIQIGHQCFCGSYIPSDLIRPRSECSQKCSDGRPCGGGWRMMVYPTGVKQPGQ